MGENEIMCFQYNFFYLWAGNEISVILTTGAKFCHFYCFLFQSEGKAARGGNLWFCEAA